ncbi:hypothetical protein SARC_13104, partial [Sphaeroforma arctica JP610]
MPAEDTLVIRRASSSRTEGDTKDWGIVTDKDSNATDKDSNATNKGLNATDKNSNAADDDRGFETVDQGMSLTLPSLTELTSGVADP